MSEQSDEAKTTASRTLANVLATRSGVDDGYIHIAKQLTPGEPITPHGAILKWYALHAEGHPVPAAITELARQYLEVNPLEARGFGFVVLHRCGADFYFLLVSTWRNANELWESVYYKDGDAMDDFAPFPRDHAHKPTFCVWELVPVRHEQQAWERFLKSDRNLPAAEEWLGDRYTGLA